MSAAEFLDELDALHAAGTADGEWRLQDNGTRHGPECRFEILDDEGSVAVCSDDNDATETTGADRTALIVAAVNALPKLTAAVRAVEAVADEWERTGSRGGNPALRRGPVVAVLRGVLADALAGDS